MIHHRVWRLAILSSMRASRDRARSEAADLLERSDHDPTVVAWCLFRGIDVDLAPSERALGERYSVGADQTTVQVLGLLLTRREEPSRAIALLAEGLDRQSGDSREEALVWIGRLESERDGTPGGAPSVFTTARETGDWEPVGARLSELLSRTPPEPTGLALAEGVASEGRFGVLASLAPTSGCGVPSSSPSHSRTRRWPRVLPKVWRPPAATTWNAVPPIPPRL